MTFTLCNSHPFTFYLPFHTSLRADQCPVHAPSTCTLGLDPCARHPLFGRTDPYYIDNFYSSCGLKRPATTLAFPLLCNCTVLPVPLSTGPYLDFHQAGSVRRMLMVSEGVSVVRVGTLHRPWLRPTWPVLMAVWSKALPMTASCLSPLPGFESLLGHEGMMPLTWDQAVDFSGFPIGHTCLYAP